MKKSFQMPREWWEMHNFEDKFLLWINIFSMTGLLVGLQQFRITLLYMYEIKHLSFRRQILTSYSWFSVCCSIYVNLDCVSFCLEFNCWIEEKYFNFFQLFLSVDPACFSLMLKVWIKCFLCSAFTFIFFKYSQSYISVIFLILSKFRVWEHLLGAQVCVFWGMFHVMMCECF